MTFIISRLRIKGSDDMKTGKYTILKSFYEVYLVQNACAILLKPYIHIDWLYVLGSLLLTILVAWGEYMINTKLSKVILK